MNAPPSNAATPFIPDFSFVLDDLNRTSDAELRARAADAYTRLVLVLLRHGRRGLQSATVLELADLFDAVMSAPNGLDAVRQVLRYILEVGKDIDAEALGRDLGALLGNDVQEVIVTTGETLRERALREGLQTGRQEGLQTGRQEGMTTVLLRLLQLKFDSIPEWASKRVQEASPDLLERWTDAILTANSIDEVFAS